LDDFSARCYPNKLGPLKVLATSTDGNPAVCYADNEGLKSETCGRVIVDCGWTKNYCSWHEAGTARYVSNATIWLLGLEHKMEIEEEGGMKISSTDPAISSTTSTSDEVKEEKEEKKEDEEKKEVKKESTTEEVRQEEIDKKNQTRKQRSMSQRFIGFFTGSKS